jgi:hypothetical protein
LFGARRWNFNRSGTKGPRREFKARDRRSPLTNDGAMSRIAKGGGLDPSVYVCEPCV